MVPKKVGGAGHQRGTRKEVSMATLRAATTKGTVTLNWNTYQTRYLPKEGWRGKKGLKISEQNDLSHRPASKQANAMQTTRPPSRELKKVAPEPQRGATADRHCLEFNLA